MAGPRELEDQAAKEMCKRVDVPWQLGLIILAMVRVSYGSPANMVVFATALKYASDNRHLLKRSIRTYY
jgi:hypothetical protein